MPLRITVAVALVLASVATASADEPTLLDLTISTCVGPGFGLAGVPHHMMAGLPEESCVRACKTVAQGCKAVVRAVDECGLRYLKAAAKTEMEVCRGRGGSARECRGVRDSVMPDIDWWKAAGKVEQADCDADTQTFCLNRCRPAASLYESLIPSGQFGERPKDQGSVTTVSGPVLGEWILTLKDPDGTQGRAHGTIISSPELELITTSEEPEVREAAEAAILYLE